MAQKADGTLYIETAIEKDGFVAGGKEVEAACKRMAKTISGIGNSAKIALKKQTDAFIRQNQQYAQQQQKVEALKNKLKELSGQKVETKAYANLEKQFMRLDAEISKLIEKQERFLATGGRKTSSTYKRMEYDLEQLGEKQDEVIRKMNTLERSGGAYTTPDTSAAEAKLGREKEKLLQMNHRLGTSYESLKAKVKGYAGQAGKASGITQSLKERMAGLVGHIKRGAKALLGLGRQTKNTRMSMGKMLATSLLFGTVFRAFSTVTNGIKEGFQNLAQYSDRTNQSISSLISAMTQLKNSFATAFAPILSVVTPYLTTFINLISKAVTYVGMFIAALTGQDTFTKAVGVQEDYAAGLRDTADSANDAADATEAVADATNDYLSGLDEVNRFTTDKPAVGNAGGGGSGGGGTPGTGVGIGDMFETVKIENSIAKLADKIKALIKAEDWEGLGAYMASGVNKGLQKLYDAINWDNVGPQITYFINAFTTTLNSLVDHIDWDLMGRTIGAGINTIVNTLNLLITGIDWVNLGKRFAEGVMGIVREVEWNNLGQLIGNKFMIAWRIFYGFVTNLNYEEIGLAIADGINGILETLDLGMLAAGISTFVVGLLEMLSTTIKNTNWEEVGKQIAEALRNIDWFGIAAGLFDVGLQLINGLLEAFGELPLPVQLAAAAIGGFFAALAVSSIITSVIGLVQGLITVIKGVVWALGGPLTLAIVAIIAVGALLIANWDDIKAAFSKFKEDIVNKWTLMTTAIKEAAKALAEGTKEAFETLKENVRVLFGKIQDVCQRFGDWLKNAFTKDWRKEFGILGGIVEGFFKNIKNLIDAGQKVFGGIVTFLHGVFTRNWKQAWEGIKSIFKGVWDTFVSIVKSPINIIIGLINGLLYGVQLMQNGIASALNHLSIDLPGWLQDLTGYSSIGFNIGYWNAPQIPYLASGAVIPPNKEFLAVLGDQKRGTNIETPEALLRKIVREEMGQSHRGGGSYTFVGQINRRTLFEEFMDEAKLRQMQNGKNPFELA